MALRHTKRGRPNLRYRLQFYDAQKPLPTDGDYGDEIIKYEKFGCLTPAALEPVASPREIEQGREASSEVKYLVKFRWNRRFKKMEGDFIVIEESENIRYELLGPPVDPDGRRMWLFCYLAVFTE